MRVRPDSMYALKDLYEEIRLFDRKISHCKMHEVFDFEEDRAAALQKLVTKRAPLVKAAVAMAGRGVECDAKYMPRSLKQAAESPEVAP